MSLFFHSDSWAIHTSRLTMTFNVFYFCLFFLFLYANIKKPWPWIEGEVEVKITLHTYSETTGNMLKCAPAQVMWGQRLQTVTPRARRTSQCDSLVPSRSICIPSSRNRVSTSSARWLILAGFLFLSLKAAQEKLPHCRVMVSGWYNQQINQTVSHWLLGTVSKGKASVGILSHQICQGHNERDFY